MALSRWLLVLLVVLAFSGCDKIEKVTQKVGGTIREGREANALANAEVALFHERFNAGDYAQIYESVHPQFKKAQTEEALTSLLFAVKERMGNVQSASRTGWNFNFNKGLIRATSTYNVIYEKGKGTETFHFEGTGEKMEILGWTANSDRLNYLKRSAK